MDINGRSIGPGRPAYIVAELSGNHNGDRQRAVETIHAAAEAGADAIKLQTYTADTITIDSDRPEFVVPGDGAWGGRTLYELYEEAHTPWEWHAELFAAAAGCGIDVFSSPFDATAVEFLEELGCPAYKIASFELVDDDLLKRVAATGKPVVASTGMATLEEILHAVAVLREGGAEDVLLLRCTSSYPAPDSSMNLSSIPALASATDCAVGLSDHSLGTTAPVVAVAMGACLIEKHLTLSRSDGGVDSHFSLEPDEFAVLVRDVRRAEEMIGLPSFAPATAEDGSRIFRRSLYIVQDLEEGEPLTPENVRSIRPGHGLPPRELHRVLGRKVARRVERGTALAWDLVGGPAEDRS